MNNAFYLGIDAGATKVEALAINEAGEPVGHGLTGPANHHYIGIPKAMERLKEAVSQACGDKAPEHAVFGLAGADLPEDYKALQKALEDTFSFPFTLANDIQIAFHAGTDNDAGGVIIGGTGANAALRTPDGAWHRIRAMGYQTGCGGGALEMVQDCLHVAYQSNEGTGPKSELESVILKAFEVPDLDALVGKLRPYDDDKEALSAVAKHIVPQTFRLAEAGDEGAQTIIINHGTALGTVMAGICRRAGYTEDLKEVLLVGGLFRGHARIFTDAIALALHRAAPNAELVLETFPPALGGALMAIEASGLKRSPERRQRFLEKTRDQD